MLAGRARRVGRQRAGEIVNYCLLPLADDSAMSLPLPAVVMALLTSGNLVSGLCKLNIAAFADA